jgi:hypothetical protein
MGIVASQRGTATLGLVTKKGAMKMNVATTPPGKMKLHRGNRRLRRALM